MLLVLVVGWLEGKCNNFYISTVLRDQWLSGSAVKRSIGSTTSFPNHGEGPYWPNSAFTFKTLLRHYAKWVLTPQ